MCRFDRDQPPRAVGTMLRVCALLAVAAWSASVAAQEEWPEAGQSAQSRGGITVSVSRPATEVGAQILEQGGNAVDAAVAVAFALAVTWPEAGNIGGGGFMVIHPIDGTSPTVIEYREKAPAAATADMFVRGRGAPHAMAGVPGTVRGLELAHRKFGKLPWKDVVSPAVKLAQAGVVIDEPLAKSLNQGVARLREDPAFVETFGKERGSVPWAAGDRLTQRDLAKTLQIIADEGADGFYTGSIAALIVAEMKRGNGLITLDDLRAYQANECQPVHGTFRGYDLYAPPPPSSGGITLMQMLHLAEIFDLRREPRWSARTLHLQIEAMRLAYLQRARFLGDPDFVQIPDNLATRDYAAELARTVRFTEAGSSSKLGADILSPAESPQTTHFSVIDSSGMAVANTYTLENSFGAGVVVRGAGFLLNDEMADFNPQPNVTTSGGQIGTPANLVAPGKRMLSSMCPVVVAREGRPVLVTGSPGGRTIINTVFCVLINVLEYGLPLRDAVDAPRHHHQWMPDRVLMESALLQDHVPLLGQLRTMGHVVSEKPHRQGDAHSIFVDPESRVRWGVADRRIGGWAAGSGR